MYSPEEKHSKLHSLYVCLSHFEDPSIKKFIRNNYENGKCNFCASSKKVISLYKLKEFILDKISLFYEDAANFLSYDSIEGGYLGEIMDLNEILATEGIEINNDEIINALNSAKHIEWGNSDKHYGVDKYHKFKWDSFKSTIKHKSRYLFLKEKEDNDTFHLDSLKKICKLFVTQNLVVSLKKGTILYRCRQHNCNEKLNELKHMVSPPDEFAVQPNRFSPAGVSMFYAAFDKETAIKETVTCDKNNPELITIANLKLNTNLYILNLSKPLKTPSIFKFNKNNSYKLYYIKFINNFILDISENLDKNPMKEINYAATQVFTEYIRYKFNERRKNIVLGFKYQSSRNEGKEAIVLFLDHKTSLKHFELEKIETFALNFEPNLKTIS